VDPTVGSPQEQAITWLATKDLRETGSLCSNSSKDKLTERYIMAVLYFSLKGDGWNNCGRNMQCSSIEHEDSHLSSNDYCNWYGVTCIWDIEKRLQVVKEIILDENNLSGTIPNEVGHLYQLEIFSLQGNNVEGQIPPGLYKNNMKEVLLSKNKLSGTLSPNLEQMASLDKIYIDGNNFTRPFPDAICQFDFIIDCAPYDGRSKICKCCKFCNSRHF